ncbi:MAG: hypothetical protein LRY45_03415 [Bacteroides graminisolvens]|nr:hypothetical protein [Bacteroides graminisolvens]
MADYLFEAHRSVLLGLLFCLFLLSFFLLLSGFFYRKYTFRWLFGAGVYVFFLTLGMAVCSFHLEKVVAVFPMEEATSRVVLTNHVQEKEKKPFVFCLFTADRRKNTFVFLKRFT